MPKQLTTTCLLVLQDKAGRVLGIINPRHRADEAFVDRLNHVVSSVGGTVTVVEPVTTTDDIDTIQALTNLAVSLEETCAFCGSAKAVCKVGVAAEIPLCGNPDCAETYMAAKKRE